MSLTDMANKAGAIQNYAGMADKVWWGFNEADLQRFAELVIQEHCKRMSQAISAMPFGSTSDSFAVFVREFK